MAEMMYTALRYTRLIHLYPIHCVCMCVCLVHSANNSIETDDRAELETRGMRRDAGIVLGLRIVLVDY